MSEVMFHLAGIFRTLSPGDSNSTLREVLQGHGGREPGYREDLQQKADSLNVKILLLIKVIP